MAASASENDFDRLMQAALKDIAAELGRHEVVRPGLLHRIISEVQRRYAIFAQL